MIMKLRTRRRTLYSVIASLGFAAMIFLYFQVFSVTMIDLLRQKNEQKSDKSNIKIKSSNVPQLELELPKKRDSSDSECKTDDCAKSDRTKKKAMIVEDKEEIEEPVIEMPKVDYPRGIKQTLADKYRPDASNMFTCLHSNEVIPFDEVNDDFCDCADGSDEPGTPACIFTRFVCTFQGPGIKNHEIPSSRVNDGICDCCDGSDEWNNMHLPEHVALHDNKSHYGMYQVPCENRCQEQIAEAKRVLVMRKKGAVLKQEYIQAAYGKSNPDQLYGPKGEFYQLSENCYEAKFDKYEYTVCPFKEVKQQDFPSPSLLIGKRPQWEERDSADGHLVLRMVNGESRNCPGHINRETFLIFECGLTDAVTSVQETEVCQYSIKFSTPAAC